MERFLLFDAGCAACSRLARALQEELGDRARLTSFDEPAGRDLLERTGVGAARPVLVEVDLAGTARAYAGLALYRRLRRLLGTRAALRFARSLRRARRERAAGGGSDLTTRRRFLRRIVLGAGGVLAGGAATHGGSAAAAPAPGPRVRVLPATQEAIAALRGSATAVRAEALSGTVDWSQTTAGYVVERGEMTLAGHFLVVTDAGGQRLLFTPELAGGSAQDAFLFEPGGADGFRLGPLDGETSRTGGIITCIQLCLQASFLGSDCQQICLDCLTPPPDEQTPVKCSFCLLCAQEIIIRCYQQCRP